MNQDDKYFKMLKKLNDKIRYSNNYRMREAYYKVSEKYQKEKAEASSDLTKTVLFLLLAIGSFLAGGQLWEVQEKILGFVTYIVTFGSTTCTIVCGMISYNSNKKHRKNKRLISRIYNSFKKECSRDPSIMSQYKKDKEEAKKKAEEPFDTEEFLKSFETESKPKENNQPKKNSFVYKPEDNIFNQNLFESVPEEEFKEHRGR